MRRYDNDVSDSAAGDSDDDGDPERARRELGATRLPLTDPFGDPVPIGKGAPLRISFSCARDFDSIRLSLPLLGFDSLVVGTSVGSAPQKYSRVQLDSPERSSFLHRHHLKVTVVTVVK